MNAHHEQALQFLHKAEQDALVVSKLGADPDIAAEILGFHAQQATEKIMKAVLAERQVAFPHTHRFDVSATLALLKQLRVGGEYRQPVNRVKDNAWRR